MSHLLSVLSALSARLILCCYPDIKPETHTLVDCFDVGDNLLPSPVSTVCVAGKGSLALK